MDAELSRFKSEISLTDYAQAEFGYELVIGESGRSSKVLKRGGDKIIVTRKQDGHDVYFSTGDSSDCGSILDFLQKRKNINLGLVHKELRQWLPGSKKPTAKRPAGDPVWITATSSDQADVLLRWNKMEPYGGSYLTDERRIASWIIEAFGVRQDDHGNACIEHIDQSGTTGWESKNQSFTGFAAGGQRSVSFTRPDTGDLKKLVIVEAAIDAMSWAQIKDEPGTGYISTGGTQLSQLQRELLSQIITQSGVSVVVLAMDRDEAGERMAREVASMVPQGVKIMRDVPEAPAKDWNDALQAALPAEAPEIEGGG